MYKYKAISVLQTFFARKRYQMPRIPLDQLESYHVLITGNDPEIEGLNKHLPHEKILLVGTSGLRSVELACAMGGSLPKLLLIDNSQQVIKFWMDLQALMSSAANTEDALIQLLEKRASYPTEEKNDKIRRYFNRLSDTYGFERVKAVILHTTIIPQDWCNTRTFEVINQFILLHQYDAVYAYPSNIVAYLLDVSKQDEALAVLRNIELLNPTLAIHTDLVLNHRGVKQPKNVLWVGKEQHSPSYVLKKLNSEQSMDCLRVVIKEQSKLSLEEALSGKITLEEYNTLPDSFKSLVAQHLYMLQQLIVKFHVSFEQLIQLNTERLRPILSMDPDLLITLVVKSNIPFESFIQKIIESDEETQTWVLNDFLNLISFFPGKLSISLLNILALDETQRLFVMSAYFPMECLTQNTNISFDEIIVLDEAIRAEALEHYMSIITLVKQTKMPLSDIFSFDKEMRSFMFENDMAIASLMAIPGVPLQEIFKLDKDRQALVLDYRFEKLLTVEKICFKALLALSLEELTCVVQKVDSAEAKDILHSLHTPGSEFIDPGDTIITVASAALN